MIKIWVFVRALKNSQLTPGKAAVNGQDPDKTDIDQHSSLGITSQLRLECVQSKLLNNKELRIIPEIVDNYVDIFIHDVLFLLK
jgi:hypothetical protein